MPKTKLESNFGNYFKLPNPGLRTYFGLVRSGQPDEYRTVFYRNKSLESVLSDWDRTLKSIRKEWPTLYEFESDMRDKVGPMSIMRPLSERMSDIDAYYDLVQMPSKPVADTAVRAVVNEFGSHKLDVRSQPETVARMKLSTSSGNPFFTRKNKVLNDTVPCSLFSVGGAKLNTEQSLADNSKWDCCAILGWRGQEGGPKRSDVKQRVVWMFPFAVNVSELQVYQPLIEYCQSRGIFVSWIGNEAVDEEITKLFDTKGSDDLVICTDFSKFDQHFNVELQNCAINILGSLFSSTAEFDNWLNNTFPVKYNIPLAYDWNKIRHGEHGMASGSGGTNADETLVHRALQYEVAQHAGKQLNPHSLCLGDDGILSYPGITVDDVMRSYTQHGLEMNESKQYASTQDCVYLRRWHHKNYRVDGKCAGVYSTFRALGRLCEQERFYDPEKWSKEMVALRQLSIIENVKNHPLRERFADYCIRGDKYRLGIDIPGFLDNIDSIATEAIEEIHDFMGYAQSQEYRKTKSLGLSSWWIVNYLKSKSRSK